MNIYRNINFVKRDYECTNLIFCQSETLPNDNYRLTTDNKDIMYFNTLTKIYSVNNASYYGYL